MVSTGGRPRPRTSQRPDVSATDGLSRAHGLAGAVAGYESIRKEELCTTGSPIHGGRRTPYRLDARRSADGTGWPVRVDQFLAPGVAESDVDRWVQSASVLHSNGDAFDFAVRGDSIVGVRGRAGDRVNRGRLGPKDLFGWQAIQSADRLTRPLVRSGGRLVPTTWDDAMGARRRPMPRVAGRAGRVGSHRLLQLRPARVGGLLHARCDRQGRDRHAAHGREHSAVHGDRRRPRSRRRSGPTASPARTPTSTPATRWPVGSQRRRDPDGVVGAGCSIVVRDPTRRACSWSTRDRRRRPSKPTSICRRGSAPTWR